MERTTMNLPLSPSAHQPGLTGLVGQLSAREFSVCVRSALSTLIALAGGANRLQCVGEGLEAAQAAGDAELADLFRRALEELEAELISLQPNDSVGGELTTAVA